jgi:hypothetical protein
MARFLALLVLTAAVATSACGSSHREQEAPPGATAGQAGSGGLPTTGGSGGTSGAGGTSGVGSGGSDRGGTAGRGVVAGDGGASDVGGAAGSGVVAGQAGSMDPMPSQHDICVEYMRVVCNRTFNECAGAPIEDEPCEDATDLCPDRLFVEGSKVTVADVVACIARWKATSCDDISRGYSPVCNLPRGDSVLGMPCAFSVQCESGRCGAYGTDEVHPDCGVCIEKPLAAGDPCEPGDQCPTDSECSAGICTATYVSNQPPGALCTRFGQCVDGHRCFDTEDGAEMRCQPIPTEGEPCDRINVCTVGLFCSESGCAPSARAGEPCSVAQPIPSLSALQYICTPDAVCDMEASDGPTCVPRGAAGEPCTPAVDVTDPRATCLTGLNCICGDETCATGTCSIRRYAGDSCAEAGARCVAGSTCVDGTCEDTGLQGLAERACGTR